MALMIIFFFSLGALERPVIARLFASVPPEVDIISCGFAPMERAIVVRALFRACWACSPRECGEEGLP